MTSAASPGGTTQLWLDPRRQGILWKLSLLRASMVVMPWKYAVGARSSNGTERRRGRAVKEPANCTLVNEGFVFQSPLLNVCALHGNVPCA